MQTLNIGTYVVDFDKRVEFYKFYLGLINIKRKLLTEREIDIVSEYMFDLNGVRERLGMQQSNFSNALKVILNKGYLTKENDTIKPHKNLLSLVDLVERKVISQFTFNFKYDIT